MKIETYTIDDYTVDSPFDAAKTGEIFGLARANGWIDREPKNLKPVTIRTIDVEGIAYEIIITHHRKQLIIQRKD